MNRFTRKKKIQSIKIDTRTNNNMMMMMTMEMDDLGLGSIPDLLFAEQLDVVPQIDQEDSVDHCQQQQDGTKNIIFGTQRQNSLFRDLEEFSQNWIKKSNDQDDILDQAMNEADIGDNVFFGQQSSPVQGSSSTTGSEDGDDDVDCSQKLIDEMEEFLADHEMKEDIDTTGPLTANESKEAEDILDALLSGNVTFEDEQINNDESNSVQDDSGYLSNISNISEIVTEDGQKVVIIIANDLDQPAEKQLKQPFTIKIEPKIKIEQPQNTSNSSSPTHYYEDSEDPDWSPDSPVLKTIIRKTVDQKSSVKKETVKAGKVYKRGPYKRSTHYNIKDKKERKKLQNVEAARRYRDRKKAESGNVIEEVSDLDEKNKALKIKEAELKNEIKTMKKLMAELGLVK